jgi:HSP20 family protein
LRVADPMLIGVGGGEKQMPYFVYQVAPQPQFHVRAEEKGLVLTADLPGVKEEDLDITVARNLLTVAGKREGRGTFARKLVLPEDVDGAGVNAALAHGVLTLTLPRKPEAQPRKIAITAAAA